MHAVNLKHIEHPFLNRFRIKYCSHCLLYFFFILSINFSVFCGLWVKSTIYKYVQNIKTWYFKHPQIYQFYPNDKIAIFSSFNVNLVLFAFRGTNNYIFFLFLLWSSSLSINFCIILWVNLVIKQRSTQKPIKNVYPPNKNVHYKYAICNDRE